VKETRRVTVEVTAVEVSDLPELRDLQVYKHVSRFIRYRVDRVVSGDYDGREIIVGHWATRDRRFTEAARYKVGDRFVLTCEPYGEQDEITLAQTIDTLEDIESDRWWAAELSRR
jgi:hypothetical protein